MNNCKDAVFSIYNNKERLTPHHRPTPPSSELPINSATDLSCGKLPHFKINELNEQTEGFWKSFLR